MNAHEQRLASWSGLTACGIVLVLATQATGRAQVAAEPQAETPVADRAARPAEAPAVSPRPSGPRPSGLQNVRPSKDEFGSSRDELRIEWRERLLDTDLRRREQSFDRLIQAVRRNPSLAGLVQTWAVDASHPGLAWTARLALRELGRAPGVGLHGHLFALPTEPTEVGGGLPPADSLPVTGGEVSDTFSVLQGPQGTVVRLQAVVDGEPLTKTFEGATLEEILGANPGLHERMRARRASMPRTSLTEAPDWWASPAFDRPHPWSFGPPLRTDVLGVVVREPGPLERARFGQPLGGLLVERVLDGTIAEFLGLRGGELLVELNGVRLESKDDITDVLARRAPEEAVRTQVVDAFGRGRAQTWLPAPQQRTAGPLGK